MKKAVIFDLDQTLLDTNSLAKLRDAKNKVWGEVYKLIPQLVAFEGIDDIMEYLYENDIAIIIITNSPTPYCSKIVSHCNWKITGQICFHDVNNRKPHPESFLKAIQDFDLDKTKTISAGDKDSDIKASKDAGIAAIACPWASPDPKLLLASNPNFVANNVDELFAIIKDFFTE